MLTAACPRILALILLALLPAACDSETPRLAKLPAEGVVLAFGDSLTHGTGARPEQSYPAVLQALIGRRVVGAGVPGEVTAQGLLRLPALLRRHKPNLLILCHGANDMLRRMAPENTAANLRAMVRLAKERDIDVVLIGVAGFGYLLGQDGDFYAQVAAEFRIPYDAETLHDILTKRPLKSDAIHPNARGYRKLAHGIAALLKESGAI